MTDKQKAWVDYFKQGHSAAEAARLAGYRASSAHVFQNIGAKNRRRLAEQIRDRDEVLASPRVADMREINEFWTRVMRDENADIKDRLKASEARAKAAGGFSSHLSVSGTVPVVICGDDELA